MVSVVAKERKSKCNHAEAAGLRSIVPKKVVIKRLVQQRSWVLRVTEVCLLIASKDATFYFTYFKVVPE